MIYSSIIVKVWLVCIVVQVIFFILFLVSFFLKLNCGLKQAVIFFHTCFVILFLTQSTTLIANDDCEIEREYIDSSINKKNCADGNKEDLKSCIWQSSVYEIPLDTNNGCVNGESGQITYDYVDMVTENKKTTYGPMIGSDGEYGVNKDSNETRK